MPDRILIVHQGAIGDLIVSLPSFHAIRQAFHTCSCDIMGYPHILRLVESRYYADRTISADSGSAASLYRDDGMPDERIRQYLRRCASVFIFGGAPHEQAVMAVRAAAKVPAHRIATRPDSCDTHVIDYQLSGIRAAGIRPGAAVPRLYLRPEDHEQAGRLLHQSGICSQATVAAIAPGSGSPRKNWPESCFCLCIEELNRCIDIPLLIIEGPAEEGAAAAIMQRCPGPRLVPIINCDLPVLAAVLARCSLYIGNDSGTTHMAAALGVPTVAVFGPTDQKVWGPRGSSVRMFRKGGSTWSDPGEVAEAALQLFRKKQTNTASGIL